MSLTRMAMWARPWMGGDLVGGFWAWAASGARRVAAARSLRALRRVWFILSVPFVLSDMVLPLPHCFAQNLRTKDFRFGPRCK